MFHNVLYTTTTTTIIIVLLLLFVNIGYEKELLFAI